MRPISLCAHAVLAGLILSSVAHVSIADQSRKTSVPNLEAVCRPEIVRDALAELSSVVTLKELPAENSVGTKMPEGTNFVAATKDMPAFCQLSGSFVTNPRTGKTANFLATFPAEWNGKYLQFGCSGHCGQFAVSNAAMPTITITNQGLPGQIIQKGYASIATDEGHVGVSGGAWAVRGPGEVDEDAIEDFYYRADKVLAQLGKKITIVFYSRALKRPQKISRSYMSGCSGGGRDGFVAASSFPEEFDGIVAGSAYNLVGSAFQFGGAAVATLRSGDAYIPPSLVARIDQIVKAQCDKVDGVEDGLIQNPAACDFRPERDLPRCDGRASSDRCFTQAQIDTISTVLTAVTDEDGNIVQPGYSLSELQPWIWTLGRPQDLSARDPWPDALNSADQTSGGLLWDLANATLKTFVHKNDSEFFTRSLFTYRSGGAGPVRGFRTVVPKAEVARALNSARMGIGHFPEKAEKLIQLDRKFLIWHNLSDAALTPYTSINYYKQLAKLHGGYAHLQKNVRLFLLPGTPHCSGSGMPVGPGSFDALTAIENWVEKGEAPDALLATLYEPTEYSVDFSKPLGRTMPLCKFPTMARYSGKGDVNDATNWSCPPDDTSMLEIGESGRRAGVLD